MFMTHFAPPNGLDPGDRMPGTGNSIFDEMDDLMGDWSWREGQTDPGRVYTPEERDAYVAFTAANPGKTMPAVKPWSFPAYTGAASRPRRIGG